MLPETINIHELIDIIITTLDARDPYTMEHSFRVAEYSEMIARHMNLDEEKFQKVHIAAHLHDIGKIGVPDTVLNKPGKLSLAEMKAIQSHSRFGYNILKRLPALEEISEIVLYHHERFDGMGYPEGLKGGHIPIESRIIAVADAFDAMTSDRPYRKGICGTEARKEIILHSGEQFCPEVVHCFSRIAYFSMLAEKKEDIAGKQHFAFAGHEYLMHSKWIHIDRHKINRAA